jgi:FkbM family methyltransferase
MLSVYYGVPGQYSNVTQKAHKLVQDDCLRIPAGDCKRRDAFGDPLPGILKSVKIVHGDHETTYDSLAEVEIYTPNLVDLQTMVATRKQVWESDIKSLPDPVERLAWMHQNLDLVQGSFQEEYPEQLMAVTYLKPDAMVLELGANIGRNTCIIATVLNDDKQLVTLECDPVSCDILQQTRDLNGLNFHIENTALSKVLLAQQGWNTVEYTDSLPDGHVPVKTITFPELEAKYDRKFDTIVADCEGALFQILRDEPTLLTNITTVILENDFTTIEPKRFVDEQFTKFGLKSVFSQAGGWGPCYGVFFQVWMRS